ncbi:MAG: hypothetical protein HC773_01345 [Scytonema sp. CRU_2_7]|nr:hypothetical protein [Scytonema sp. CRU_2_7]
MKERIARRIKSSSKTKESEIDFTPQSVKIVKSDVPNFSIEDRVLDLVGDFYLMIESLQDGNTKFSYDEILVSWWKVAYGEVLQLNQVKRRGHRLVQIASGLYLKSHRKFKITPPRGFIELHETLVDTSFINSGDDQVIRACEKLAKFIKYTIKQ